MGTKAVIKQGGKPENPVLSGFPHCNTLRRLKIFEEFLAIGALKYGKPAALSI